MPYEYLNEKNKKVLELENRRKIYELVRKYSGSHFRELERKSKIPIGILKYHLDFLNKHGLIKQEKDGNNTRYFLANIKFENMKLLGFLRQKSTRRILLFILTNEKSYYQDIVKFVELSQSTVSWHIKKLIKANIISEIKEGKKLMYSLLIDENELIKLFVYYKESFFDSLVNKAAEMWDIN